ncbi:MAG: magnesium transporter CorA family protein [Victivallaceae bacterium]|nr:magnesium transporter CorA family protein [Victivallaceae bacterium]
MLRCYDIVDGRVQIRPEGQMGMIQVYSSPTAEEKQYLVDKCRIDEHTLNSSLDEDEISRIEFEPNHVAVIMKRPRDFQIERNVSFRVSSIGAFLFEDRIIIVQADRMPLFEHGRMPLRGNTVQGVLLRLLHHSTAHFLQHLRIIRNMSDDIETKIEGAVTNKSLVNMFALSKSLTYYESATSANEVLLLRLRASSARIGFNTEEQEFLDDIEVENKQCDNLANIYTGILTSMSEARASVVSNNLAVIMKYLAVINIVFLPLTVLTGLGGMSEFTMMTEGIWWPHAYSAPAVAMVLIGYIAYLLVGRTGASPKGTRSKK